jgi:hypothetical protein
MELLGPNAKRRRSKDVAAGEPPPQTMEATEAANTGSRIHSKESTEADELPCIYV